MKIGINYLESAKNQFLYYKNIGEKAIYQLEENQLFISFNEDSNSIATIIKHLSGNMISRWTDFFTTDGEKDWRNRDAEFENEITTTEELLKIWNNGWDCFFESFNSIQPKQLSTTIFIRNEPHSVIEAINRQLAHYPFHIGQIIFYAKMLKKSEWESLSIPKKGSSNLDKFSYLKNEVKII